MPLRWRNYGRAVPGVLAAVLVLVIAAVVVSDRGHKAGTPSASRPSGGVPAMGLVTPGPALPAVGQTDPNVRITAPTLVFNQGGTVITVAAPGSSASWSVVDQNGQQVAAGTVRIRSGAGSIGLSALGPGLYYLTVAVGQDPPGSPHTTASFAVLAPLPPAAVSPVSPFGVGIHASNPANVSAIPLMAQVGFAHARLDVKWDSVETPYSAGYTFPASYDDLMTSLSDYGITPLPIADYNNPLYDNGKTPSSPTAQAAFGNYANAILNQYSNLTSDIEIYNEFNIPIFNNGACGMTPSCYLAMLSQAYRTVKADHPNARVVGGVTAGLPLDWLNGLFDLGGLKYLDVVSVHPYGYPGPPEQLAGELAALRAEIRAHNGGRDLPIWITETGWTTNTGNRGVSEADQADYLIRAEAISMANGVTQYYWYDLVNDGADPTYSEDNFGLLRAPATGISGLMPKPGLVAQAVLIRALAGLTYRGSDPVNIPDYSLVFGAGARTTRIIWSVEPSTVLVTATGPVTVTDEYGVPRAVNPVNGQLRLPLSGHPVFVSGPVTGVTGG